MCANEENGISNEAIQFFSDQTEVPCETSMLWKSVALVHFSV